jgi:oxygen-independent coproporphyrinogen-3 oxidase
MAPATGPPHPGQEGSFLTGAAASNRSGGPDGVTRPGAVKDPGGVRDPGAQKVGVYVHFPWCLQKCGYCDFLSVATPPEAIAHEAYASAVLAELARRREALGPRALETVFFGGGTPSLWRPSELGRVLEAIRAAFPTGAGEPEVTVECNPSSFDEERAKALVDVGVTRVSIGVQSLDPRRLAFLGRLHDPAGALDAVNAALRAGVPRVSADLIFGVAGESAEEAVREAMVLADLGLTHLSVYALTIEPGTQFGALARKGRLPLLPEDAVADSFVALHEALTSRGFDHYEISNYARGGAVARHNLGYWHGDDYVGLGCGAWGTVTVGADKLRYRNTPVPDRYLASASAWAGADLARTGPGELVVEGEHLPPETQLAERLMLGLRLAEGVDVEAAALAVGAEPWPPARTRAVLRLVARNRLHRDGPHLRIPYSAWLLADGTISELL